MLSLRLLLSIAKIYSLDSIAIDFVLAFPQANLHVDIWIYLSKGFQVDGLTKTDSKTNYILKLNKSLHDLKQTSFNWNDKLKTGLED